METLTPVLIVTLRSKQRSEDPELRQRDLYSQRHHSSLTDPVSGGGGGPITGHGDSRTGGRHTLP